MKKITQQVAWMLLLFIGFSACSKSHITPAPVTPPVTGGTKPTQVTKDGRVSDISYNADGSIQSIKTTSAGSSSTVYTFNYDNGKLKEIVFGGKWIYTYTGNHLSRVETYNAAGELRYTYDFTYAGSQLIERVDGVGALRLPQFKTTYFYRADGNIEHTEHQQYTNDKWHDIEKIYYTQYDLYTNVTEEFTSFPYLPANMFSPNNSLKEDWRGADAIDQQVTHTYTYNADGKVLTKKSTFSTTGSPPVVEEVTVKY